MLSKSQESDKNCYTQLLFSQSARSAWKQILANFLIRDPQKILLPPYIGITDREGSGIFDPVRETQTPFEFYQLNDRLGVDLDSLESQLAKGIYRILLLAHYFGFCRTDIGKIRELCDQYGVVLVEDCAHALSFHPGNSLLGTFGDFSVYSIHKFLPIEKGGILRVNNPSIGISKIDLQNALESTFVQFYAGFDLQLILDKRLNNYSLLYDMLKGQPGIEVMYDLQEGDVPHDFPILVKHGLREKLYFALLDMGVPTTALYYRLIDEIKSKGFQKMQEISNSILNLPIHQDVEEADLELMVEKIGIALKNLRA
jgi:dTDP-4-amino-4,6-dideoxygalactose transaminase